jgi:chromosome segregation ATPase
VDNAARIRADYEVRISELEDRLSDTDESVNQTGVAMQVKIKELYSEVDKLWASAWRRNKAKIEANEKGIAANAGQVKNQNTSVAEIRSDSKAQGTQIDKFSSMLAPLRRMLDAAPGERAQIETLADRLHKLDRDFSLVQKRVGISEEDIEAINGFRRQVWAKLADIERLLPSLQGQP